ncbi:solute carrier family 2, facilitated glucose transporter member 6-like [Diorhabda carinulata]|uniref:solute carrier family 2, facilitated glucose transporter member 6-like n=1 Tax=Diorhabda carinulata TaxID=1163345 RepID=UPI0025A2C1F9|nr:solute carrier family 2, facilitated glucose transporter member 6-like [Diorhabda carinulata]
MIIQTFFINNLVGSVIALALMGFMFGFTISWSSPVMPKIQNLSSDSPFDRAITDTEISWMTSLVVLGSCCGCWMFGFLTSTIGRRFSTIILGVPMATSYLLMAIFRTVPVYYVARFIMGFTLGGGNIVSMTYASEISSQSNRGVISTVAGTSLAIGTLFCYSIGPWVSVTELNIILSVFPLITIAICIIFCEESPYYYLVKGEEDLAKKALMTFRPPGTDVDKELEEILIKIEEQKSGNFWKIIKSKSVTKSLFIGNMLLIFQQFTGINGISMYSQSIFDETGSNLSSAVCSIILGALQLTSGSIAPIVVDRFNRRSLMIVSASGMILFEVLLGIYCVVDQVSSFFKFVPILCLAGFMFSYNFGIGPLCWVVTSEIYAARIKSMAMAFSVFVYYVVGFVVTRYFKAVQNAIGIGALFFIFAGCCGLCIAFIVFCVIETKGKTLEQIQDRLER